MSGPNLPKLQDAINLRTTDTSIITHYQIQSALELRLDSFDGDPRTVHCSVSSLPSPVRNSFYSDPGNILLAENIRRNSKYLTQLLTCRVKSAPIGLLHPTMGLRTKAQATTGDTTRGAISAKPRTAAVTVSAVPATEPVTSHRTEERKTKKSAQNQRFMIIRTAPAKTNKGPPVESNRKTKRANSAKFQEPLRARSSVRRRSESFTTRTRTTSELGTNNRSFSAEPRRNGVSLNSKREQNIAWSRTKGSQGLSLSNICRPLPISYNNFLVQTTSST
ncbi:uncharacterized protein LOC134812738 [Bolinopsis microptera]|uniref:uncharacterized protein LOC134812738 n=1 Tax=Bolinopsis microptera TaxID=2820187 RepID=UPI00307A4C1E